MQKIFFLDYLIFLIIYVLPDLLFKFVDLLWGTGTAHLFDSVNVMVSFGFMELRPSSLNYILFHNF